MHFRMLPDVCRVVLVDRSKLDSVCEGEILISRDLVQHYMLQHMYIPEDGVVCVVRCHFYTNTYGPLPTPHAPNYRRAVHHVLEVSYYFSRYSRGGAAGVGP